MAFLRRDPEARRNQIIAHATKLFAARGYENTSVNDVASDAGVSIGTLYKYFADKPALLEAVLADFETAFVEAMRQVRAAPGHHQVRLRMMVHGLFELASKRDHFFWALNSGTHGLRGERLEFPGAATREEIALFIESGIRAKEFRDVNVKIVAALGFGVVETAMRHCFSKSNDARARDEWEDAVYTMLSRNVALAVA